MEATTAAPQTENGSPLPGCNESTPNPHLKNPECDSPADVDALQAELVDLSSDLTEAKCILELTAQYVDDPKAGCLWAACNIARRAVGSLDEASMALSHGHTGGVACRMEDVSLSVMNAAETVGHVQNASPGGSAEKLCGPIALSYWSLQYVHDRLDHLVYECELPV